MPLCGCVWRGRRAPGRHVNCCSCVRCVCDVDRSALMRAPKSLREQGDAVATRFNHQERNSKTVSCTYVVVWYRIMICKPDRAVSMYSIHYYTYIVTHAQKDCFGVMRKVLTHATLAARRPAAEPPAARAVHVFDRAEPAA